MYLVQVKSPAESHEPWDYEKVIATIAPEEAWRPLAEAGCDLVKRAAQMSATGGSTRVPTT